MSIKILALIGDYWHPAPVLEKGIRSALTGDAYDLAIRYNPADVPWDKLSQYDMLLLAQWGKVKHDRDDEANRWMTKELQQTLASYVTNGGSLFVLHSGLADQDNEGLYRQVIKGHFIHHPKEHPEIQVTKKSTNHPVLEGVTDFTITDEQYFVEWDAAETTVLLTGASEEHGASAAAWVHPYGSGRVLGLTPGHTEAVLMHPMMQRLIQNGVQWCTEV